MSEEEYVRRMTEEGLNVMCKAFQAQQAITAEMQEKKLFGKWEYTLGAAELSLETALAIYKELLAIAMADMDENGDGSDEGNGDISLQE